MLGEAADCIVSSTGANLEQYEDYLSHGELWGGNFLQYGNPLDPLKDQKDHNVRPYFGLCNPMIMKALQEPLDVNAGIQYLRRIAKSMNLNDGETIICYSEIRHGEGYYEYCTAVPHPNPVSGATHARWIKVSSGPVELRGRTLGCHHISHRGGSYSPKLDHADLDCRLKMVEARGERGFKLDEGSLHERTVFLNPHNPRLQKATYLFWENPAPLFQFTVGGTEDNLRHISNENFCSCLTPQGKLSASENDNDSSTEPLSTTFQRYAGTLHNTGRDSFLELFIRTPKARYSRVPNMTLQFLTLAVITLSHPKDPSGCKVCCRNQTVCGITSNATEVQIAVQNLP